MTAPLQERLAELASLAETVAPGQWLSAQEEVYEEGCDIHPVASFSSKSNCRTLEDEELLASFCATANPANVAKLCEQVRVMKEALEKIEAIKDQIDGGDWDEIAKARGIAHLAMLVIRESE